MVFKCVYANRNTDRTFSNLSWPASRGKNYEIGPQLSL